MADFFEHLNDILFLDIETISGAESLRDLPSRMQEEWTKKAQQLQKTDEREADDLYFEKAGIYAEFGKVICIGVGYFTYKKAEDELIYRTKSYAASTEHETLLEFRDLLEKKDWILCAHNGKEFDIPYLCRRMLVNKLPLPDVLQLWRLNI